MIQTISLTRKPTSDLKYSYNHVIVMLRVRTAEIDKNSLLLAQTVIKANFLCIRVIKVGEYDEDKIKVVYTTLQGVTEYLFFYFLLASTICSRPTPNDLLGL